jgi:predicted RNA-binding Zn-ribbon protein involved in translation (DUF1610 family)
MPCLRPELPSRLPLVSPEAELFDIHKVKPDGTTTFYSGDRTQEEAEALRVTLEAKGFSVKIVPAVPVEDDDADSTMFATPKCPTCGSNDLERFRVAKKVSKAVLFGPLGLRNVTKQFRCQNCGYRW